MKNQLNLPAWKDYYNWGFVILLTFSLGLVMFLSFNQGYDQFSDHFYQKSFLIENFNHLRMKIGDRVFPQVLVGKNGWLEYTGWGNLDDFQNASKADSMTLERIQQKLISLDKQLKERNITLLVVIAPNKATIYPEDIPEEIKKLGAVSRLDKLVALLRESDSQLVLDLRPALQAGRQNKQIYYKTDTHWNDLGAYIAYKEIMNRVSLTDPDLRPLELSGFTIRESKPTVMDLSRIIGTDFLVESKISLIHRFGTDAFMQYGVTSDGKSLIRSWAKSNGQNRTLLMYHDSFGISLLSLLQYHFREATYILVGLEALDTSWIDKYNPDFVVIEIVERNVGFLDTYFSK
jgi:hypothetical protein